MFNIVYVFVLHIFIVSFLTFSKLAHSYSYDSEERNQTLRTLSSFISKIKIDETINTVVKYLTRFLNKFDNEGLSRDNSSGKSLRNYMMGNKQRKSINKLLGLKDRMCQKDYGSSDTQEKKLFFRKYSSGPILRSNHSICIIECLKIMKNITSDIIIHLNGTKNATFSDDSLSQSTISIKQNLTALMLEIEDLYKRKICIINYKAIHSNYKKAEDFIEFLFRLNTMHFEIPDHNQQTKYKQIQYKNLQNFLEENVSLVSYEEEIVCDLEYLNEFMSQNDSFPNEDKNTQKIYKNIWCLIVVIVTFALMLLVIFLLMFCLVKKTKYLIKQKKPKAAEVEQKQKIRQNRVSSVAGDNGVYDWKDTQGKKDCIFTNSTLSFDLNRAQSLRNLDNISNLPDIETLINNYKFNVLDTF